jgi:dGTPase
VTDVVSTTEERLEAEGVVHVDEVRSHVRPLASYSVGRRRANLALRKYLYRNLYYNPVVHGPNRRAVRMLRELFGFLLQHPNQMGALSRKRVRKDGLHRAVCDYISGMTDRYCFEAHQRWLGPQRVKRTKPS